MPAAITASKKLDGVRYDIRGPVLERATAMEEAGERILKLHIGNPAPFGFEAPDDILKDVIRQLPTAQGYGDSHGLYSARVAIMQYCQQQHIKNVSVNDIFIGNGVSEMIMLSLQALLNDHDEVLLPSPDYPLWTGAVRLSGGKPVHYRCSPDHHWQPDVEDIESKITAQTRAIVIINPNNPTGACYSRDCLLELIDVARRHGLMIFSDEIYDKIVYDDNKHIPTASLCDDVVCVTMGGLSKNYRVAGFRVGWMILSGDLSIAQGYVKGLELLASMRLCANMPCQYAIQTALGGYQSINDLIKPEGRLRKQRDVAFHGLAAIDGLSVLKPQGALYCFVQANPEQFNIRSDEQLIFDILVKEKILLVPGSSFNFEDNGYFRVVFLPTTEVLQESIQRLGNFFANYKQN